MATPRSSTRGEPSKGPRILPPRSAVRLVRANRTTPLWRDKIGTRYRIGYYSRQDGLGVIWLVDERGRYEGTIDRNDLDRYFVVERMSTETDLFGERSRPIGPLRKPGVDQRLATRIRRQRRRVTLASRWPARLVGKFKWPVVASIRQFRPMLARLPTSARRPALSYYFTHPTPMTRLEHEGSLDSLLRFLEETAQRAAKRLRQQVLAKAVTDWQFLVLRSRSGPDTVWLGVHTVRFVEPDHADIWPLVGICRLGEDRFAAWALPHKMYRARR